MNDERPLKDVSMDNIIDEVRFRGFEVLHATSDNPVTINDRAIVLVIKW